MHRIRWWSSPSQASLYLGSCTLNKRDRLLSRSRRLRHLAILLGREARAKVWSEIIAWINLHSEVPSLWKGSKR